MNIKEFYILLEEHDWTYEMSDDHSVWGRGGQEYSTIKGYVKQYPEFELLFKTYEDYAWGRGSKPNLELYTVLYTLTDYTNKLG